MPNYPRQRYSQPDTSRLSRTEVSETDLYLLGAIEKLAYRVDYLEHRLKKTDQLLLQLVAENKKDKESPGKINIHIFIIQKFLIRDFLFT